MSNSIKNNKRRKEQILDLRSKGLTYNEISDALGCSKSVISYHCGDGSECKRVKKRVSERHPIIRKISAFRGRTSRAESKKQKSQSIRSKTKTFRRSGNTHGLVNNINVEYTYKDVLDKIGPNPKCYLTGKPIDLRQPNTYNLDHIIPTSKGGTNDLSNLEICTKEVNFAKGNLSVEEFIRLCNDVIDFNNKNI
jgi:5-methylcytosine-specific restriction endonuclease McrA